MAEHTIKQFDLELDDLKSRVLLMGGIVEQQMRQAMQGLYEADQTLLANVEQGDSRLDEAEIQLDTACNQIIAKRQPTAIDLRIIIGVQKTGLELEKAGNKAVKIARTSRALHAKHTLFTPSVELRHLAEDALDMLRKSLDAFARSDTLAATEVLQADDLVDAEYRSITRQLITFMMEDPRTISLSLEIMNMAKAIERVADHARAVAENLIYITAGMNVRHFSVEEVRTHLLSQQDSH
ncbi:MAG: phosphate transport system regulatory protein PhoU [Rhodocyclales bacterium]|nr:phosphate transport system regulatory protein PhoU [Rhodocyclales bacterium]